MLQYFKEKILKPTNELCEKVGLPPVSYSEQIDSEQELADNFSKSLLKEDEVEEQV